MEAQSVAKADNSLAISNSNKTIINHCQIKMDQITATATATLIKINFCNNVEDFNNSAMHAVASSV